MTDTKRIEAKIGQHLDGVVDDRERKQIARQLYALAQIVIAMYKSQTVTNQHKKSVV